MTRRWLSALCALVGLLASAPLAMAQTGDPAVASRLFQEGREAAKRGDYAAACPKLNESYRIDPAVGTLLNLADCSEHLGKTATAWQLFQQAVAHLDPHDDRVPIARKRIAALEPRLSRLEVTLPPGTPSTLRVTRDSLTIERSSLGAPQPVDPGGHVVVVAVDGHEDHRIDVAVPEAQTVHITAEVGPMLRPTPPTPPPATGMRHGRLAGMIVGGVGIVGVGVAVGTGLAAADRQRVVSAHCGPPNHPQNLCDATGYQAAKDGQALVGLNAAAWAVGAAATVTGGVLFLLGKPNARPDMTVEVAPVAGGAVAAVRGRF